MNTIRNAAIVLLAAIALSACAGSPVSPRQMGAIQSRMPTGSSDTPRMVVLSQPSTCAVYARQRSGIDIHGDAVDWWGQAQGRYATETRPNPGGVMVLVGYSGPKHAHLAVVTRVVSSREIRVDHANWMNDGNLYLNSPVVDVSPNNDWSVVKVWNTRDGHLGGNSYTVQGFIAPYGVNMAANMPLPTAR